MREIEIYYPQFSRAKIKNRNAIHPGDPMSFSFHFGKWQKYDGYFFGYVGITENLSMKVATTEKVAGTKTKYTPEDLDVLGCDIIFYYSTRYDYAKKIDTGTCAKFCRWLAEKKTYRSFEVKDEKIWTVLSLSFLFIVFIAGYFSAFVTTYDNRLIQAQKQERECH